MVENVLLYLSGLLGALIPFILNNKFKMGAVLGSAVPSLFVALTFIVFPNLIAKEISDQIALIFYGAAFIGMASDKIISNLSLIAVSGLEFSFIFIYSSSYFKGYGGALGTTACVCFLTIYSFKTIFNLKKI